MPTPRPARSTPPPFSRKPGSTDVADRPLTTANQILAKDTGKEPFNAPKKLLAAIQAIPGVRQAKALRF